MNETPNSKKFNKELKEAGLTREEAKKEEIATVEEVKNKALVRNPVKVKQKSKARKMAGLFVSEDVDKVKDFVFMDVLVPAVKKAISDVVTNGIDIILYGESGRSNKSRADRVSYRNYNSMSSGDRFVNNRDMRSNVSRGTYDYADVIFTTRGEAESVLMAMDDVLAEYRIVKVSDFYEFADVTSDHAAYNYGWTDLRSANVIKVRDGWMIKLPRPLPID